MGIAISRKNTDFEIIVKTGDVKGAGTDSNVYCVLIDSNQNKSRNLLLDVRWRNDFEKGSIDVFKITNVPNLDQIEAIELWRDKKGIGDDWFVECINVKQYRIKKNSTDQNDNEKVYDNEHQTKENETNTNNTQEIQNGGVKMDVTVVKDPEGIPFPCNRWIEPDRKYLMLKYDSILPQFDPRKLQRSQELDEKRIKYSYLENAGLPKRIAKCPREENFSNDYKWDIVGKKIRFLAEKKFTKLLTNNKWNNLNDLMDVYKGSFGVPYGYYNWKSDEKFGQQRLRGCNSTLIKLCTAIPSNFAVTNELLEPYLDGLSLEEALAGKELYIIDFKILEKVACKDCRQICAPIALFHAKKNGDLLPVAIQLFQEPAEDNPVFLSDDPPYTWMLAKMYFNNADCALHQACTHLGFTHLVVETICIAAHRTLSPSHPVFRLLAPHFLYLIAINSLAVEKLLATDGWIDVTMTMGVCGLNDILKRTWSAWRLDVDGWLPADLEKRGVNDVDSLPLYVYRDDALLVHNAIVNYVTEVLTNVYDTPEKLTNDFEVQAWADTLVNNDHGAGIKGVFGNGKFHVLDDLIKTTVATIFLSSVGHAAANFCQYDEYAFPPNYPAQLNGKIPRDKTPRTEQDIINHLPNKDTTLSIMVVTKLLSDRGTKPLGDFEVQYQYEPKAVAAVERFRAELREISDKIKERNSKLVDPYPYLDPEEVPNAISI